MSKIKKAVTLIIAILVIFIFTNSTNILASTIPTRNSTNDSSNNTSTNNASANNTLVNNTPTNNTPANNTPVNNTPVNNTSDDNTPVNNSPANNITSSNIYNSSNINKQSNTAENIPHTGISDTYFNFALIVLLAVVLGMFSFVQYNKIAKKDNDD